MIRAKPRPAPLGRFLIVCRGFSAATRRRQPWHMADGLARGLVELGHEAVIVTEAAGPQPDAPYAVRRIPHLFTNRSLAVALFGHLLENPVDRIFIVTGLLELVRAGPLRLGAPTTLIMASPRLRLRELLRLGPAALWRERALLALPLANALLPARLLSAAWRRTAADEILYLSRANRDRLTAIGLPYGPLLLPQVDAGSLPPPPRPGRPLTIAYLGPALDLRGADLAVAAFEAALARGLDAELRLMLRPDGVPGGLERLLGRIARSPAKDRISHRTEMLSPPELAAELAACHVLLLPFRVTVSEVPLVVVEGCLSGRPTVVLEAPGVSEVAKALGGIVARSPAELSTALIEAAARLPAPVPDATAWTSWKQAAGRLLAAPHGPFGRWRLLALLGVDGSGKSFLIERLGRRLDEQDVPHRHLWSRYRNYLSKPLLALARLTGHNRKERHGAVRVGYHDFAGRPWLTWPFLLLQLLDLRLDLAWRYRGHRLILADRCAYDTLVDLAVDTGLDDLVMGRLGRWILRRLPRPHLAVVLVRPVAAIAADRPDALLDRHFARRRALYERLARELGLPVLVNDGPPERVLDALERLLATDLTRREAVP